ncbi:unnamed protein product, partial [Iphiclides podalirius]
MNISGPSRIDEEIQFTSSFLKVRSNVKVQTLENTLLKSIKDYRDLITEFEDIFNESECYRNQVLIQKEKCESESCVSSEALKKVIAGKDDTIQSIGNILKELIEKKDFNIINNAFRIIYGEQFPLQKAISLEEKAIPNLEILNRRNVDDNFPLSDLDECATTTKINDISSGRKSPIIPSKIPRNRSCSIIEKTKPQEKKKCPDSWPTSEEKALKLLCPTPAKGRWKGRYRQSRLSFVTPKTETAVDLTCSMSDCEGNLKPIKMESIENDDTILPSPTSGQINFTSVYKSAGRCSPYKQKKSLSTLKPKGDEESIESTNNKENKPSNKDIDVTDIGMDVLKESNRCESSQSKSKKPSPTKKLKTKCTKFIDDNDENMPKDATLKNEMEESIDILRHFPNRFLTSPTKQRIVTPTKSRGNNDDVDESMSLLHRINKIDDVMYSPSSPSKRPLSQSDIPPSLSVLRPNFTAKVVSGDVNNKRTKPDLVEPIFKEPTVRKKAEKLALPGWSCDECKEFYAELYKDDPVMLRQKMEACSRHRGRRDPARPKTPPGFWQPRWNVPTDTDDFNRRNDAL